MSKYVLTALAGGVVYAGIKHYINESKTLDDNQHVVIVGGGYGGIKLANNLKGKGSFTLIDPKDSFHHNMAALRAATVPGFYSKTFIPYKPTFGENFKQAAVKSIDVLNKNVILSNDECVPYTELVIATGSGGPFPGKCDSLECSSSKLAQLYKDFTCEVQKAEDIVIVGGGAVGVEMSGEIRDSFPDKKITILHGGKDIVSSTLEEKARANIMEKLKEKNIDVLFGEKVTNMCDIELNKTKSNIQVETSSGKVLKADLVIPCFGSSTNTSAYSNSLSESMNKRGQLKVNEFLQVEGYNDIFAIGDCNNFDVTKLALEAQMQSDKTFQNLVHIGRKESLDPYKKDTFRMVVPIGRDGGVCQNGKMVMGDFLARKIKAEDVFVSKMWKDMSQTQPKN